ncbi:Uncharacterised protein [Mycobacteroides abscessus subsp. massiliense]|nr:Uncharacterised protein [Mycobacteroides abscessus subsp. massiliense]
MLRSHLCSAAGDCRRLPTGIDGTSGPRVPSKTGHHVHPDTARELDRPLVQPKVEDVPAPSSVTGRPQHMGDRYPVDADRVGGLLHRLPGFRGQVETDGCRDIAGKVAVVRAQRQRAPIKAIGVSERDRPGNGGLDGFRIHEPTRIDSPHLVRHAQHGGGVVCLGTPVTGPRRTEKRTANGQQQHRHQHRPSTK